MGTDRQPLAEDLVLIGEIVKTRGLKGEIKIKPLTDVLPQFDALDRLEVFKEGQTRSFSVKSISFYRGFFYVFLHEVDSAEDARHLVGGEIFVPRSRRISLPQDTFYFDKLEGSEVISLAGEKVGFLTDVLHLPAADTLVIDRNGREVFVPFVEQLVPSIDADRKIITIIDMPSLWEE